MILDFTTEYYYIFEHEKRFCLCMRLDLLKGENINEKIMENNVGSSPVCGNFDGLWQ